MSALLVRSATVAALGLCLGTAPAFAHAHLKGASPPVEGTVAAAPTELDLTFSEGVDLAFTGVVLTGPGAAGVATGPAAFGPKGDATVVVPVMAPLPPGAYAVAWHALAKDGHRTTGRYGFTVKP